MTSMSRAEYDAIIDKQMSEEALLTWSKDLGRSLGWRVYHTRQVAQCPRCHGPTFCRTCRDPHGQPKRGIALGSDPGWPDLVFGKPEPGALWVPELKSMTGRPSPEQEVWLEILQANGVRTGIFRPSDRERMQRILLGQD